MINKKEYVEREAALKVLAAGRGCGNICSQAINRLPAADVEEVRHGYWYDIVQCEDVAFATCSVCNIRGKLRTKRSGIWYIDSPYCPICGARMDGKGEG